MSVAGARVFAMMTGDYPNIGDALIRERVFAWVRKATDAADVYVGSAPQPWMDRLGVRDIDRVYSTRQVGTFFAALLRSKKAALVVEPGELDLGRQMLLRHAVYLLFAATVRAKGGVVVLPPRAVARNAFGPSVWVHRKMCVLAQHVWWRNARSLVTIGRGELAPDVAFGEPVYWGEARTPRNRLVVSMRGPRPWPGDSWVDAVAGFAKESGLEIVCAPQVRQDEARAKKLANVLGGTFLPWGNGSDVEHEQELRRLYQQAALTVSDRLHVLILASLGGSVPAELAPNPAPKVAEHFEAIGYGGASMDSALADVPAMWAFLERAAGRSAELRDTVLRAQADLSGIEQAVLAAIAPRTSQAVRETA